MKLNDITIDLETRHRQWATDNQDLIENVSADDVIGRRIVNFIEEAIRHPTAQTGDPKRSINQALKLTSMANFRLGLMVGMLLASPDLPKLEDELEKLDTVKQAMLESGLL
jgi:hypothetical protein